MSTISGSKLPNWAQISKPDNQHGISHDPIETTYHRLKLKYAQSLRQNWVEKLEQPKQILEQLYLAAYLIELWRGMYGTIPAAEQKQLQQSSNAPFAGFVSLACGSGILVYVLCMEGYNGSGFDACRRKTWETYPVDVQTCLEEKMYIPQPFLDAIGPQDFEAKIHTGDFPADTFIISDHADEMTVWTPLMAALASPSSLLPFLIIPCCSCSLSGARYRYPPRIRMSEGTSTDVNTSENVEKCVEQNHQPASGDLRSLRATKAEQKTGRGFGNSMMGSLTAKTRDIAEELGFVVEEVCLQTPGAFSRALIGRKQQTKDLADASPSQTAVLADKIAKIIERECVKDGGIQAAARLWIEQAKSFHLEQR
ncbi:uncharacterized protein N7511_011133 [Penicillium nucicola]|uniref:uncharacterized protein n=1 Tax=Penicillium nucicola TaxID=1850975 RepID=UPI002545A863|nr:uncharacterized protein N7511_011133 [Penicillium nucicola]KAJ5742732.1 hypothetical protein N7511_011133 [Penicillium nucicola]